LNKLQLVTNGLEDLGAFDGHANKTAKQMADLLGDTVPFHMALAIANYTMATFVGHFHYKIDLGPDNKVPMNVIIFVLAKSGAKKTSSMTKLEKAFKDGYGRVQQHRLAKEKLWAEENDVPQRPINPLSSALATEAGMVKRLNDFKAEGIGCPALYVDEISTELASNPDMLPNIKLVAQLFDDGDMKSKPLKDPKMQSQEVNGMGMTALFIGSEHGILEDPIVLTRFTTEFISKLARRSMFIYPKFKDEEEEVTTLEALLAKGKTSRDTGQELNRILNSISADIASKAILNDTNNLKLSDDCAVMWEIYSIYCEEMSKLQDEVEAVQLEQQHRHWKALKLAGVYAVMNQHDEVEIQDLKEAIYAVELTGADIGTFIEKANRQPYEILLQHYEDGGPTLSVHEMVKKRWINKPSDVKNIIELANSKSGKRGMVEIDPDGNIRYTSFGKKEGLGFSAQKTENLQKLVDNGMGRREAKAQLGSKAISGYVHGRTTFEKIGNLLRNDRAYSPFEFRGGIRGKDYIISGADFIVLDVDDTEVSDTECADMLADYNYIIARGSDANNPYKYRILLPLDVTIQIENDKWKPFLLKVGKHLGINVDALAMAQIYFGYEGRELLTNSEGINLEASEIVKNIDVVSTKTKRLSRAQLPDAWDQRMYTFSNAYNAKAGQNLHTNIWYATVTAHDLGFSLKQGLELLKDILDYIDDEPRAGYVKALMKRMQTNTTQYPIWVEEARLLNE